MPRAHPGSTLGVHPVGQGVIPGNLSEKNFCDRRTHPRKDAPWTDRRDGRNSYLDRLHFILSNLNFCVPCVVSGDHDKILKGIMK